MINFKRNIKFRIGSEDWEMPLGVLLLLIGIALLMVLGGAYLGFKFGKNLY